MIKRKKCLRSGVAGVIDLTFALIKLAQTDDLAAKSRYKIHLSKYPMFLVFASEHNSALSADLNDRAISELHCAFFELSSGLEHLHGSGHMIASPRIEIPHVTARVHWKHFFFIKKHCL